MFKNLSIRNFRCFDQFEMHDLGRVNLLVGTNNSGKTSVLEAIELLCAGGDIRPIWSATSRRGETFWEKGEIPPAIDVRHLFRGHHVDVGSAFSIEASDDARNERLLASILERQEEAEITESKSSEAWESTQSDFWMEPVDLQLQWEGVSRASARAPLTEQGGLSFEVFRRHFRPAVGEKAKMQFVTTDSLSPSQVALLFGDVVLTPEEGRVVEALRTIEPAIERIALSGAKRGSSYEPNARGGLFVKCAGIEQRIPIGSLGDGIWRMLGLALALAGSENGVLLVDEIDTGLHYSVMVDMWRMVAETAKRLNVQVFATTHSRDCYESLAAIAHEGVAEGSEVTIQRIEREKGRAVAYTEQEIVAAAEHGVEVR